ncbi:high-potential iron-sulfur protein [Piscinibacter koreensis]|uniref:High-potential iron-sulfur protein n=1 Tax=Piscinibacter koreensis TaxID=2742824 RepID=A0A7Y6NMK6_9BURK|nr:high-potential iron-sulfur protein [Schlegelella koreensis]NUZ05922.1 high-potential iron-sulfur protein [Schlegelella koreensis]
MTNRRIFLTWLPAAGAALAAANATAQTPAPMVDEKEPQAVALGYVHDAKRVDKAKFPKYAPPQRCAICQFYQGAATLPTAPCTLFAGKRVAGPGWCSAYVPKAA